MHTIEAIVTTENFARELAAVWVSLRRVSLAQGYVMIPLADALKDDVEELVGKLERPYDCFQKLSGSVLDMIKNIRCTDKVAYLETEFFGGVGEQAAIVWQRGEVIYGPELAEEPHNSINQALKILGVRTFTRIDEFEEVNLHWKRSTQEWYEAGK